MNPTAAITQIAHILLQIGVIETVDILSSQLFEQLQKEEEPLRKLSDDYSYCITIRSMGPDINVRRDA